MLEQNKLIFLIVLLFIHDTAAVSWSSISLTVARKTPRNIQYIFATVSLIALILYRCYTKKRLHRDEDWQKRIQEILEEKQQSFRASSVRNTVPTNFIIKNTSIPLTFNTDCIAERYIKEEINNNKILSSISCLKGMNNNYCTGTEVDGNQVLLINILNSFDIIHNHHYSFWLQNPPTEEENQVPLQLRGNLFEFTRQIYTTTTPKNPNPPTTLKKNDLVRITTNNLYGQVANINRNNHYSIEVRNDSIHQKYIYYLIPNDYLEQVNRLEENDIIWLAQIPFSGLFKGQESLFSKEDALNHLSKPPASNLPTIL